MKSQLLRHQYFLMPVLAIVLFCACTDNDEPIHEIRVGDAVPAFKLKLPDGNVFDSTTDIYRTTLIAFFHTDCPDCQKELPVLQQLYNFAGFDISFLLISRQESGREVEAYWKDNELTMPYCPQEDRTVFNKFARNGIPRGYVVDKKSIVQFVFSDRNMPDFDELRKRIVKTYE